MHMFSPTSFGTIAVKNKIVALPFHTRYAHADGGISNLLLDHYRRIAATGVGLVVVEASTISPLFQSSNSIRCYGNDMIADLRKLADTIHAEGAAAVIQICHTGRFSFTPGYFAPSAIAPFGNEGFTPKEMTPEDMRVVREAFATAANCAKEAGFDGVELHGGTGYLLASFISPRTNIRRDEYGGSLENRARFPLSVAQLVRSTVGDFPVGWRLMATEHVEGGLKLQDSAKFAKMLVDTLSPCYLSVMSGTYECFALPEMQHCDQGYMLCEAEGIKKAVPSTPVIAAGHLQTPEFCEEVLRTGKANAIGLGRVLFCDQEWVHKASGSNSAPIIPCVQCDNCIKQLQKGNPTFCAKWPKAVRESRLEA